MKPIEKGLRGTVIFFNTVKGFGFIKDSYSDLDYFFHYSGLKCLVVSKDDKVRFDIVEDRIKTGTIKATNIEKI